MNRKLFLLTIGILAGLFALIALRSDAGTAAAQGPLPAAGSAFLGFNFTYQGQLKQSGVPVTGNCDFQFALYDAQTLGTRLSLTQTVSSLAVSGGLFTTLVGSTFPLDTFNGDARFLNIQTRCPAGAGGYTTLSPRQALTAAPYALALPGLRTRQTAGTPNVIGGSTANSIAALTQGSTVLGGGDITNPNSIDANYAAILGGSGNAISAYGGIILGGGSNRIVGTTGNGFSSVILGGTGNVITAAFSAIASGDLNRADNQWVFIGSGEDNSATDQNTFVGNGLHNNARVFGGAIVNGFGNIATGGGYAFVGDGVENVASGRVTFVGDGQQNHALGDFGFIGGGVTNTIGAASQYEVIGGGQGNLISSTVIGFDYSTIAGGELNVAGGYASTVGGGQQNKSVIDYATIAGGYFNSVDGNGYRGAIGGGYNNHVSGLRGVVPGGESNAALGSYSFAAGLQAKANNQGCFVWADSINNPLNCNKNDLFLVRASGGISLSTGASFTGCTLPAGSGAFACTSDRSAKANFSPVDSRALLAKVDALPISQWNYKAQDAAVQHIGPMAQDFYAAFHVGDGDTTISSIDESGVAFAAIQGLSQQVQEKDALLRQAQDDLAAQQKQIDALQQQNAALDARLSALEKAAGQNTGAGLAPVPAADAALALFPWIAIGAAIATALLAGVLLARGRDSAGRPE